MLSEDRKHDRHNTLHTPTPASPAPSSASFIHYSHAGGGRAASPISIQCLDCGVPQTHQFICCNTSRQLCAVPGTNCACVAPTSRICIVNTGASSGKPYLSSLSHILASECLTTLICLPRTTPRLDKVLTPPTPPTITEIQFQLATHSSTSLTRTLTHPLRPPFRPLLRQYTLSPRATRTSLPSLALALAQGLGTAVRPRPIRGLKYFARWTESR